MGIFFNTAEMFDIAIGLEKNGINFYTQAVQGSRKAEIKALYDFLVGEEKSHLQYFQKLKGPVSSSLSPEALDEEYEMYLKALVDSIVFTPEKRDEVLNAVKISNEGQVLDFALGMERDSILFYLEMTPLMSRSQRGTMDKLVQEERSHLKKLSEMKEKIK